MELSTTQCYKHEEIKDLLMICPICNTSDDIAIWSKMDSYLVKNGKEGITCNRCKLDLSFAFKMDIQNEIVNEYKLDYLKIGKLEFKNNNPQLALYFNNTYVRDIKTNIVDLHRYQAISMLA